jgi:hypothetical protein
VWSRARRSTSGGHQRDGDLPALARPHLTGAGGLPRDGPLDTGDLRSDVIETLRSVAGRMASPSDSGLMAEARSGADGRTARGLQPHRTGDRPTRVRPETLVTRVAAVPVARSTTNS